ncbi:mucin-4 [Vanessa cardui]|uniref:mucin-4 n=1 Tax=Vanessa cardui TaxID=171605 RepID=UPI001F136DB2|nr:mucin-4 [Vanessa cardui]
MDRRRAAAALLALAACIACSSAAPTANDQTALELMDGPTEGCYYNFQHYGEGDRIMTNEPCLNCTCHNRMLMCYLRVCPFTKPIGQDCTVEKRADQCCPIVTCPDVPVDLLTSTSTSSPAEYGTTGVGKLDKYGCSINGKYFSEGAKVPSTPNKPCEHCYCIRNMTTCVMQECTLHVDGCTPIYHKDVCCPVRYSCDHPEDETLLLDDMTTTVRPTPGFLLTTTTVMPVTQISQDCVHDNQIFPDGTLIKTEKACEHCYCMKGDIVCVVQECGTPMENEGKNCTSLPPRHGQCCPDTYICEGDDRGTEITTETVDLSTSPPRRVGVEGSGYRNEPDEPFTEMSPFETDIEGSGEDYTPVGSVTKIEDVITEKATPDIIDEILLATTEKVKIIQTTEPDKDQNTIPDIISGDDQPNIIVQPTEANIESATEKEIKPTISDDYETMHGAISKEDDFVTTESAFRKEDNNIVADEILTVKEHEEKPTTLVDLVDETTFKDEHLLEVSTNVNLHHEPQSTTQSIEMYTEDIDNVKQKEATTLDQSETQLSTTERVKPDNEAPVTTEENVAMSITTVATEKTDIPETTSVNPVINEIDDNIPIISAPGRIPGEGDCLLNGVTYSNNTIVPSTNNCHTSCKCTSSIIKCDPIICSSPPEYMENMSDCQPIYDSPDACCPTYVCSAKETIPPQSHNQMSGTESPKPIAPGECSGQDCISDEEQKGISEPPSECKTEDCLDKTSVKQEQSDCGLNNCGDESQKPPVKQECSDSNCPVSPVVACEGDNCLPEPGSEIDSHKLPDSENTSQLICNENGECKNAEVDCKDDICEKHEISETEVKAPSDCKGQDCKTPEEPALPSKEEQVTDFTTERMAIDKVTQISLTELDVDTEYPPKTISPLIDDNLSDNPTTELVHEKETDATDKLMTVSETFTNDNTESPTIQSITEKSEVLISTEKPDMDTQPKDEFIKMTEQTTLAQDTEMSELPDGKEKVTEVTEINQMTTESEMIYHTTSESTNKIFEDNVADKIEITTESNDIYPTVPVSVTEKEKPDSEIPKITEIEIEKSTTPIVHVDETEKDGTIEDVSETYGVKDERTTVSVPIDIITEEPEKTSIQFNEVTEINELPQTTSEPQIIEIEKDELTEMPETYKPQEEMTDVSEDNIANTETIKITTEANIVSTEASQPTETKSDEVSKYTPPEIITEKQETYTESSEHFTSELEQTTSDISKQHEHTLSTTQHNLEVTDQPIREKESTSTEGSEILVTKSDESTHDIAQLVTESEEIHAVTTEQSIEESDDTPTAPITEKETETAVTHKAFTETTESDSTEKQDTYTENPKIQTISDELMTKDNEIKQNSITELPTVISTLAEDNISTIKTTEEQDNLMRETEKPVVEKDQHVSDDNSVTKSDTFEISTTESSIGFTGKLETIVTESSPAQDITENVMQPTSSEQTKVDELDYDSHKLATTLQDNVMTQEITTQEVTVVNEIQTKSPLESDEVTLTEMQEIIPSETDDNALDTSTQKSQEKEESLETTALPTSQSEHTTTKYETESQHLSTMTESQPPLDYSTVASVFEDKQEDLSNIPKEETLSEVTTSPPQDKQEIEKDTSLFTQSETSLQDMEKTTVGLVAEVEKETEPPSYVTESLINAKDQDTIEHATGANLDEELHESTERTVAAEESLSTSTQKYSPVEDVAKETTLDVSTEKTTSQDTFETSAPIDVDTTKLEMFTKFEESSPTEAALDKQEKERTTELPETYITSNDLDSTTIQKEKIDETQHSEFDEDIQAFTTPSSVYEEEKVVTKSPLFTDFDSEKETVISEKNEPEMDLTTKVYDDKNLETEKDQTIISDLYTTEPQTQASENPKDIESQHQTSSTERIITTESAEYLSTSKIHETTLSPLEEAVKGEQQEAVTENVVYETDIVTDAQPTSPKLEILNTEPTIVTTKEDEIIYREEEKTTVKSFVDTETHTSYSPEYQGTVSLPKEEMTTELTREEISTIPPKVSEQDKDDLENTELYSTTQGPSTMYSEVHQDETITEKEKSTESVDAESHTITTIKPTQKEDEEIEDGTPIDASTENLTDRPTISDTDSKETDVVDKEHKTTEIPVFTEIHTLPDTKVITEKQETTETATVTEKITESQILDQKESSTEPSYERTKEPEQTETDTQKLTTIISNEIESFTTPTFDTKHSQSTDISYHTEPTTSIVDTDKKDELITSVTEDSSLNIETTKPAIPEKEQPDQPEIYSTESVIELQTEEPEPQNDTNKIATEIYPTPLPNVKITTESSSERHEESSVTEDNKQTTDSDYKLSETTSFLVELEEHTHSIVDEITTRASLEEIATTVNYEPQQPERGDQILDNFSTPKEEYQTSEPSKTTKEVLEDIDKSVTNIQEEIDEIIKTTYTPIKTEMSSITEKLPTSTSSYESQETKKESTVQDEKIVTPTSQVIKESDFTTESVEIQPTSSPTLQDVEDSLDKDISSEKPSKPEVFEDKEKETSDSAKDTTSKINEETSTYSPPHITKPTNKPIDTTVAPSMPDVPKPGFIDESNEGIPSPDFPPTGGYGQEPDYIDEDQAFGPGTCRYGGKVYVSAQQIPRDDPCDFCFCFRSDIICLQQSCPPPIHGCHEEPIQGFCCPRYECPVSMATTLNVTTTTTTTTTTLPPHFLPHAYKGAAQRRGCQIKGHTYKVGEVVRASSGPCLHCTCGGDGQMKCDPKACTPEPMLRQMIAAAVSAKRRR